MSVTCLIVKVMVLLQLLNISSSRLDPRSEKCLNDGKIVTYRCEVPAEVGTLDWNGIGFVCPSREVISNNTIALLTSPCPLPDQPVYVGECGPYFGNLTCTDDQQHLISVLEFEANYEMNGDNISCIFNNDRIETFPVRVGVTPNPPSHVRVTPEQDRSCRFDWTSPNESVGGIGGYNITYGDCGICTPEAGFLNQTEELLADCSECIGENNNTCSFEVNTVSEDCWFGSPLVEATSESPMNSPADITVSIICSLRPSYLIYVRWIYTFSEESRRVFSGFLITISDRSGHSAEAFQKDSKVRSKYFNSIVLRETNGFVGDIWNVTVEVMALEEEKKFAYESMQLSVQDTIMADTSSTITPDQCIDVSINNHCDERSDTFQAQVQFIEGSCGSDPELTNTTSNYTLQEDYKTCVPVVAGTICYSTVIFHNNAELNRTERRKLVLVPCKLKTSNSTRVNISSTIIGDIQLGVEVMVPHNTMLNLSCDRNCTLDHNHTRCANGTFQPSIAPILQDGCRCSGDSQYNIANILGPVVGIIVLVVVVAVVLIIFLGICVRKCTGRTKWTYKVHKYNGENIDEEENTDEVVNLENTSNTSSGMVDLENTSTTSSGRSTCGNEVNI